MFCIYFSLFFNIPFQISINVLLLVSLYSYTCNSPVLHSLVWHCHFGNNCVNVMNVTRCDQACPLFFTSLWATDHYQPLRMFAGHLADITCTRFHPNSNYVVTGSSDRTIRLWDVLTGNCVRILTGHKASQLTRPQIVWVPFCSTPI